MMSDVEPPRIEFPCENYPIKIMGEAGAEFREHVLKIIQIHAPEFEPETVNVRPSKNGRYESMSVFITATGVEQLTVIFEQLKAHESVRMVL